MKTQFEIRLMFLICCILRHHTINGSFNYRDPFKYSYEQHHRKSDVRNNHYSVGAHRDLIRKEDTCALVIEGDERSKNRKEDLCITNDDVDDAFLKAKRTFSPGKPSSENKFEIGQLGNTLLLTAKLIVDKYDLPIDARIFALPLIDIKKTIIDDFCPSYLMNDMKCTPQSYREYNGLCNNLDHSYWGAAGSTYKRLLPPDFADGLSDFRRSKTGYPLPSPRVISAYVHRDEGFHDHAATLMLIAWGQAIDHDITLISDTRESDGKSIKCCEANTARKHYNCEPINVPENDVFYSSYQQHCMNFVRSQAGPRTAFNEVPSILDAGWIYGFTHERAVKLRSLEGGLLKTLPLFENLGLKDLLPLNVDNPDAGCIRARKDIFCFFSGDPRVNEQLILATIHILFVREHNRIATHLSYLNPHWDDELVYQETRRIIIAMIQHITYNEFLPMVLGKAIMEKYGLITQKDGYFHGYDDKVNPSAAEAFVTAAYRFGHSLLPSTVERWSKKHKYIGSQRLSELLLQPFDLFKIGWCDTYILGMANQIAQAVDDSVTQEVTNHLFEPPDREFGSDLVATNIQRGRDHGIPGYNEYRKFCDLSPVYSFSDLSEHMPNHTVKLYAEIFRHVDDIDLFSGGIAEYPLEASMVGPTFACLIGQQFRDVKYGDRFWYENGGWPSSFTLEQLEEIRKIKLSKIICENSDDIETIQIFPMVLPDHELNPRVSCRGKMLPSLDLTKWEDSNA